MYNLEKFTKSHWHLVVVSCQKRIFQSKARGPNPLIIYIKKFARKFVHLVVYDKIVGRAAALLLVNLKPKKVYTPIISQGGVFVLKKYKIPFEAKNRVKYITDIASKELCQWEKLAKNKTPAAFWKLVKNL